MIFTSLILSFVVALFFLINHWKENKGVIYIAIVIIGFSLRIFTVLIFNTTNDPNILAVLIIHLDPFVVLLGPFFFYYVKSISNGSIVFDRILLIIAIPALLIFINLIPYYAIPFQLKVEYFKMPVVDRPPLAHLFLHTRIQSYFIIFYNICFIVCGFRYLIQLKKSKKIYIKKREGLKASIEE